jgi:hypothetical protein
MSRPADDAPNPFEAPQAPLAKAEPPSPWGTPLEWAISLLIIAVLIALLLPAMQSAPRRFDPRPPGPAPGIPVAPPSP